MVQCWVNLSLQPNQANFLFYCQRWKKPYVATVEVWREVNQILLFYSFTISHSPFGQRPMTKRNVTTRPMVRTQVERNVFFPISFVVLFFPFKKILKANANAIYDQFCVRNIPNPSHDRGMWFPSFVYSKTEHFY